MRYIATIIMALWTVVATMYGQTIPHGVCPIGFSDCQTDGFHSAVKQYTETTFEPIFERGLVQKGRQVSCVEHIYDAAGNIQSRRTFDSDGQKLTGTLYQYRDGVKYVATMRDANGKRTLQTLYEQNDSNNLCTLMRMTDAIAITIGTTRVRHEKLYVRTTETYHDGEVINTDYRYNNNGTLRSVCKDGDAAQIITFSYGFRPLVIFGKQWLAKKMTIVDNVGVRVYTYDYETDERGEWTRRTTWSNGNVVEIAERVIEYWEK